MLSGRSSAILIDPDISDIYVGGAYWACSILVVKQVTAGSEQRLPFETRPAGVFAHSTELQCNVLFSIIRLWSWGSCSKRAVLHDKQLTN